MSIYLGRIKFLFHQNQMDTSFLISSSFFERFFEKREIKLQYEYPRVTDKWIFKNSFSNRAQYEMI